MGFYLEYSSENFDLCVLLSIPYHDVFYCTTGKCLFMVLFD